MLSKRWQAQSIASFRTNTKHIASVPRNTESIAAFPANTGRVECAFNTHARTIYIKTNSPVSVYPPSPTFRPPPKINLHSGVGFDYNVTHQNCIKGASVHNFILPNARNRHGMAFNAGLLQGTCDSSGGTPPCRVVDSLYMYFLFWERTETGLSLRRPCTGNATEYHLCRLRLHGATSGALVSCGRAPAALGHRDGVVVAHVSHVHDLAEASRKKKEGCVCVMTSPPRFFKGRNIDVFFQPESIAL